MLYFIYSIGKKGEVMKEVKKGNKVEGKNFYKKFSFFLVAMMVVSVLAVTIGYSSLNKNLQLTGEVSYRQKANMRITNLLLKNSDVSSELFSSNFTKEDLIIGFNLPTEESNFSDVEMGISDILELPENLDYEINDYALGEKICSDDGNCKVGGVENLL